MNEVPHRAVMLNDASCVEDGAHAHGASRVDDRAFADECSLGKFGMAADDGGRVGKHRKLKTQRLELLIEGAPPRGGADAAQRDRRVVPAVCQQPREICVMAHDGNAQNGYPCRSLPFYDADGIIRAGTQNAIQNGAAMTAPSDQ